MSDKATPARLRDVLDQAGLERAYDEVTTLLRDPPSPEAEYRLHLAVRYLGELLSCLDPGQYGQAAAICPVDRDIAIQLYHQVGHTGEELAAYMNASTRFCLRVGLTAEELVAEKRSERIRLKGTQ
jgi:hypothetical protein